MHIIDYLKKYKLRVVEFASRMKVTTFSVYRWMEGYIPRKSKIEIIKEKTDGEISESDWGVYNAGSKAPPKRKAGSKHAGDRGCCDMASHEDRKAKVRNGHEPKSKKASKSIRIRKSDD